MKSCELCGALFQPKRREQRFCGVLCAAQWTRAHRRTYAGADNPNFGKTVPGHVREAMRLAALGRKVSDETKRRLSETRKGKPKSPEWRQAISLALKGRPRSAQKGATNPNYRHGAFVDERVYRQAVDLSHCSECGATDAVLDVHHQDGDHSNNNPDNLQVLCHTCHGERHGRPVSVVETRPRRRRKGGDRKDEPTLLRG